MQILKEKVAEMESKLKALLKKEELTDKDKRVLRYTSDLISFRIKMITGKNFPTDKLIEKEKRLLSHFTDEDIKSLNLSILYKDVHRKIVRDEMELIDLQKKINKKAP